MFYNVKQLLKTNIYLPIGFIISFFFLGWGYVGHSIISYNTILSAQPEMDFFQSWPAFLSAHASDADNRKSSDESEVPKHYIDIDNYSEFIQTGTIPQNFESLVALHGYSYVIDQGILPWAILNTADSLQSAFAKNDMNKAMLLAADLGHYIADAHMPLHITKNYNGQLTGQYGVHSRYESDLIGKFQSQIVYGGDSLKYIDNLPDYIFNMIYDNYEYVDSVLYADAAAKTFAGNTNDNVYYNKFWEISKNFTIDLFKKASYRVTCVIYTAWVNADNQISSIDNISDNVLLNYNLNQNYPNPFNPGTSIQYTISSRQLVSLKVYDLLGREVATLVNEEQPEGTYNVQFTINNAQLSSGTYFYRLQAGNFVETRKMILLK